MDFLFSLNSFKNFVKSFFEIELYDMMTKHEAESETELSLIVLWSMINSEAINFWSWILHPYILGFLNKKT